MLVKQRTKKLVASGPSGKEAASTPSAMLEDYITNQDFSGAVAMMEFYHESKQLIDGYPTLPWLGYAAFHLGEYQKAMQAYQESLEGPDANPMTHIYIACCLFYLGQYKEAEEAAIKGPAVTLQVHFLLSCRAP